MNHDEVALLEIKDASELIRTRQLSPVELTEATLERIQKLEPTLNAFITVMHDQARRDARRSESEIQRGKYRGPLHGIPISLKDLYYTRGVRTTAGSKIMADFVPTYDCTVAARLKRAGAVIVGKNNLHEFAPGSTNDNAHYGACHNPWKHGYVPGGSSGGSGAAVAASMGLGSMGTDTAGSVRIPASLCGTVGMKPTYGRVSRRGIVALCWSLDTAGPMTRTVEDNAFMLQAIAGYDSGDPSSLRTRVPSYTQDITAGVRGLKIGVPREHFFQNSRADVADLVRKGISVLEELGASVQEVSMPLASISTYVGNVISRSESAAFHLEWLAQRGQDYGTGIGSRLQSGVMIPAVDYIKAQRIRTLIQRECTSVLQEVDMVVTPTSPIPAHPIGEDPVAPPGSDQEGMGLTTLMTRPFNIAGVPAITLPCGFTSEGLPVGLQLAGRALDEATLYRAAYAYEQASQWHLRRPPA